MATIKIPEHNKNDIYVTVTPENAGESLLSLDQDMIKNHYKEYGAILFRGFNFDVDTFKSFTSYFCGSTVSNESPGRKTIDPDSNIQTVNTGSQAFSLHAELARVPWKPDICFFGCIVPPSNGGETTLCDGIEIVNHMPENMVNILRYKRILYQKISPESSINYWYGATNPSDEELKNPPRTCPYMLRRNVNGDVILNYITTFFHKPIFSEKAAFGNFLLFSRYMFEDRTFPTFVDGDIIDDEIAETIKDVSDKLTVAINWQKNDLVMVDNSRMMHGRNTINDANERVILTSFGYINFGEQSLNEPIDSPWRAADNKAFFQAMMPGK